MMDTGPFAVVLCFFTCPRGCARNIDSRSQALVAGIIVWEFESLGATPKNRLQIVGPNCYCNNNSCMGSVRTPNLFKQDLFTLLTNCQFRASTWHACQLFWFRDVDPCFGAISMAYQGSIYMAYQGSPNAPLWMCSSTVLISLPVAISLGFRMHRRFRCYRSLRPIG